jgi:hypothetical protein
MATNIQVFDLAVGNWSGPELEEKAERTVRAYAMEGLRGLLKTTPVDIGRAKGNWQVTTDRPAEGEIDRLDNSPAGSSDGSPAMRDLLGLSWEPWRIIWFHNGVPYIRVLNDGGENRTAHMMLERTMETLRSIRPADAL